MPKPEYEFIQSVNHSPRSRGARITAIILHYTGSLSIEGTISWFKTKASKVSAHYIVGRDGRVVQMVKDEEKAWHAGRSAMRWQGNKPASEPNVNNFSIGIELVGTHDAGFTDKQMASVYLLLEILVERYRIPPERVVGHSTIAPGRKIDPEGYHNQMNWAKVREVAQKVFAALPRPSGGVPV